MENSWLLYNGFATLLQFILLFAASHIPVYLAQPYCTTKKAAR